jgi:hypothetical protein
VCGAVAGRLIDFPAFPLPQRGHPLHTIQGCVMVFECVPSRLCCHSRPALVVVGDFSSLPCVSGRRKGMERIALLNAGVTSCRARREKLGNPNNELEEKSDEDFQGNEQPCFSRVLSRLYLSSLPKGSPRGDEDGRHRRPAAARGRCVVSLTTATTAKVVVMVVVSLCDCHFIYVGCAAAAATKRWCEDSSEDDREGAAAPRVHRVEHGAATGTQGCGAVGLGYPGRGGDGNAGARGQ